MSFGRGSRKMGEADFVAAISQRPDIRLFFVYGPDSSAVSDIAAKLSRQYAEGGEAVDIDSDRLRSDPALLADEACSPSLFGGARHIRLNFRREEAHAAIENLLSAENISCPVVATAGDLKKTSRLVKLIEAAPNALSHICYLPNEGEVATAAIKMAQMRGLRLDRALAQRIAQYTGADRKLAEIEVEKLALYYDAAPDRPATVELSVFEELLAANDEEDMAVLVNIILGGNMVRLGPELLIARQSGLDAIRLIRGLQRRVTLLASLRTGVDGGMAAEQLVERERSIFFKERPAIIRQLGLWPGKRLAALNGHLLEIERQIMSVPAELGGVIMEQEMTRIARSAAHRR